MQFSANILQARRRWLQSWGILAPQRAYWRLFWNEERGASVLSEAGSTALTPETIVLVAPETHFSAKLVNPVHHLYLHFRLEDPLNLAVSGVYTIPVRTRERENLMAVRAALKQDRRRCVLTSAQLISGACLALPESIWQQAERDTRLTRVLSAMDEHRSDPLSNTELAALANMAPTAFVRLFTQRFDVSPQAHYLDMRLGRAYTMLEHDNHTIDQVAEACGFCDRNYFSTVFRKKLGVPPAEFRDRFRTP